MFFDAYTGFWSNNYRVQVAPITIGFISYNAGSKELTVPGIFSTGLSDYGAYMVVQIAYNNLALGFGVSTVSYPNTQYQSPAVITFASFSSHPIQGEVYDISLFTRFDDPRVHTGGHLSSELWTAP